MSLTIAWFSVPAAALLRGCVLLALPLAFAGCARESLEALDGVGAMMREPSTVDAGAQTDTGVNNEPEDTPPPVDAGSNAPGAITDASWNQEVDAGNPVDPEDPDPEESDDRTPSPKNQPACPAVAPEPPFNVSPCVEITLRCRYGQSYECTCYAAGWLCRDD